jgi:hypothetical protein
MSEQVEHTQYASSSGMVDTLDDLDMPETLDQLSSPNATHLSQEEIEDRASSLLSLKFLEEAEPNSLEAHDVRSLLESDYDYDYDVASYLGKFKNLDQSIALRLIEAGYSYAVAGHLSSFQDNCLGQVVAEKLIESGFAFAVNDNLYKFDNLDQTIAKKLIEDDIKFDGITLRINWHLHRFHDLDQTIAEKLIEFGHAERVAVGLSYFQDSSLDQTIAEKLIESDHGGYVSKNLGKFQGLDQTIATKLIDSDHAINVVNHIYSFSVPAAAIVEQASQKALADADLADAIVENIESMDLSGDAAFQALFNCAHNYSTAKKISHLPLGDMMSTQQAAELRAFIATANPELSGIREDDPFHETSSTVDRMVSADPHKEVGRRAAEITSLLRAADKQLLNPTDEHQASVEPEYLELAQEISRSFSGLTRDLTIRYGEDYAERLLTKSGGAGDGKAMYRRLVADYLALREHGGGSVSQTELSSVLHNANQSFMQVLDVDTKYYDRLFLEWDAKRIGEREFQEVFLGRDGVYAYIGRRAQLLARRKTFGLISQPSGDMPLDMPLYLVYPRKFRDNLPHEVKSAYLHSHIDNPRAAHYYDTGFIGTIPEDIMRVLGLPSEDWEPRIRLLSATKRDRTVIGLKGTQGERDQVVGMVEHNVKDEDTAKGLYRSDQDGGRLLPYARPNSAEQRLAFRFTQMALHRHYLTQELQLIKDGRRGEFLGAKFGFNRDKELRVSESLSATKRQQLYDIFSGDISEQLSQRATKIKVSDPDGPYPDEMVLELNLDDQAVVVKNVVPQKSQGVIDEFEALHIMQQIGVAAPKPLARFFNSGKGGMIVMEKLSGISGRAIKKQLESMALTEEQEKLLLDETLDRIRQVAETVRRDVGIDKPWRLKDFMITFRTDEAGQVHLDQLLPIDFERVKIFDPDHPTSVRLGQGLDRT